MQEAPRSPSNPRGNFSRVFTHETEGLSTLESRKMHPHDKQDRASDSTQLGLSNQPSEATGWARGSRTRPEKRSPPAAALLRVVSSRSDSVGSPHSALCDIGE